MARKTASDISLISRVLLYVEAVIFSEQKSYLRFSASYEMSGCEFSLRLKKEEEKKNNNKSARITSCFPTI